MSTKSMSILANGNVLIAGEFDETAALLSTKSSLYANGNYFIDGELDEITITNFDNQSVTYDFTANNATATFMGATISGISPVSSTTGGTYSVSNTGPYTVYGGANGGNGATQYSSGGYNYGGKGGGIGGGDAVGGAGGHVGYGQDVGGLFAAASAAGYSLSNFGSGGYGGLSWSTPSQAYFPGGGGGGINSGYPVGLPGAGAVFIKYTKHGVDYYLAYEQSSGAGSFKFPIGTTYVKIWTVGQGKRGNSGGPPGSGAGAGGVAYMEFTPTNKYSGYSISNGTVSKQYSNGTLRIAGTLDEATLFGGQPITITFSKVGDVWANTTTATFKDVSLIGGGGGGQNRNSSGSSRSYYYANGVVRLGDNRIAGKASITGGANTRFRFYDTAGVGMYYDYGAVNGYQGGRNVNPSYGPSATYGAGIGGNAPEISPFPGPISQEAADVAGLFAAVNTASIGYNITATKLSFGDGGNAALTQSIGAYNGFIPPNFGGGGGGGSITPGSTSGSGAAIGGRGCVVLQYTRMGEANTYSYLFDMANGNTVYYLPYGVNYLKLWAVGEGAPGTIGSYSNLNNTGSGTYLYTAGGGAGGVAYGAFVYNSSHLISEDSNPGLP